MIPRTSGTTEPGTALRIRVVTICNAKHGDVWRMTSQLLPDSINADSYFVYVPEAELEFFALITDHRVKILSQESLKNEYAGGLRELLKLAGNLERYGWYLQQFYKLELVFQDEANYDLTVIWDADCVPTRPIQILDESNRLTYMESATESHKPYFDLIEKVIKIKKVVSLSFVIPSFPIFRHMAEALKNEIEKSCNGEKWHEILISNIDFSLRSGLSETELLGTWVTNKYPQSWTTVPGTWERRGQKRFGYARNLSASKVKNLGAKWDLDIISFENWDTRGWRLVVKRLLEFLSRDK